MSGSIRTGLRPPLTSCGLWKRLPAAPAGGQAGFHAGARMSGGSLTIHGDAGDFLGAHMTGGLIVAQYLTRLVPYGFSGAVLVARDGQVLVEKGYGKMRRSK